MTALDAVLMKIGVREKSMAKTFGDWASALRWPAVLAVLLAVTFSLSGCYGLGGITGPRSERPVDESQVATLPTGLTKEELFQRLGPPADEQGYPNLQETV